MNNVASILQKGEKNNHFHPWSWGGFHFVVFTIPKGFPCGSAGKESACNAGDLGSIPGLGRSPGERKGHPFQYSGLENSMDCIVHGVAKSQKRLSNFHFISLHYSKRLHNPSMSNSLDSHGVFMAVFSCHAELLKCNSLLVCGAGKKKKSSWIINR